MIEAKEISITLENKPGALEEFQDLLKNIPVNIIAVSVGYYPGFQRVRIIFDCVPSATERICDILPYPHACKSVLLLEHPEDHQNLAQATNLLAKRDISVDFAYKAASPDGNTFYVVTGVEDVAAAMEALKYESVST